MSFDFARSKEKSICFPLAKGLECLANMRKEKPRPLVQACSIIDRVILSINIKKLKFDGS